MYDGSQKLLNNWQKLECNEMTIIIFYLVVIKKKITVIR